MTAMPQLVAIFNGVGGGAASLVSITEFVHIKRRRNPATYVDPRGRCSASHRHRLVLRFGHRLRQAPGADDGPARHLPRPADHQRPHSASRRSLIVTILVTGSPRLLWILLGCRLRPRHRLRPAHRRRGRAGADLAAELLHRARRRGVGLHARLQPADHRGHPGRAPRVSCSRG